MSTKSLHIPTAAGFIQTAETFAGLYGAQQAAMSELRKQALDLFAGMGIPTNKHEEWKYLNLSSIASTDYRTVSPSDSFQLDSSKVERFRIGGDDSCLIIVENGRINTNASSISSLPDGIRVGTFAEFGSDPRVLDHLYRHASPSTEPFVALNTMLSYDPIIVLVDEKAKVDIPVQLAIVSVSSHEPLAIPVRLLIMAGEGSEATIIETYHTYAGGTLTFTNSVTETVIGKNARLHHVKVQDENSDATHISYHMVNMEADSYQHLSTITLGGALVRNNLNIRLDGQNINTWLNGLYVLKGSQVVDNHTLVDHAMPHCFSSELYKGIIDDKAQGVFNGKIWVRKDAQKTNAYQSNKNLLLSNDASMNAKPQLEIFADDVKCSHGATTGQLDEESLFYLRARGIGEATARALLNHAFAADVIEQVENEQIRTSLLQLLDQKLGA